MTIEKRGVINTNTPGQCCGKPDSCSSEKEAASSDRQYTLPFPGLEPGTEKQADDIQESAVNKAIDAVEEETDGSPE